MWCECESECEYEYVNIPHLFKGDPKVNMDYFSAHGVKENVLIVAVPEAHYVTYYGIDRDTSDVCESPLVPQGRLTIPGDWGGGGVNKGGE